MTGGGDRAEAAQALLEANGLDTAWLNRVLNEAGFDGRIGGLEAETVGTGQMAENVRCHLAWDRATGASSPVPDGGPPSSVVLKVPSADETSRATGTATGAYGREVGFYRDVAPTVAMRVPLIHHLWDDADSDRFVLVMEDISPAETGNQLTGCSLERAELAVDAAAALHGSTWGRADELSALGWVDRPSPERLTQRAELFAALFPGFLDRYRGRLSADELEFGRWLFEHFARWQDSRARPQCLVHGDFRLDNILFGLGDPAPPITTVDWQTVSLGAALGDVAYFLSGSLRPDDLAVHEGALLDRYRAGLASAGVELSAVETREQYRLAAPAGYVMAVIASMLVVQTERGDDMFMVMAAGSAAQSLRLDTASALA